MNQRIQLKTVNEILAQHEQDLEAFRHYGSHALTIVAVIMIVAIVGMVAYGLTVA